MIGGGATGLVAGLGRIAGSDPHWMLAAVVLGAVGHFIGARRRGDFCSGFVADRSFPAFYGDPRTREGALAQLGQTVRRVHELPLPSSMSRPGRGS